MHAKPTMCSRRLNATVLVTTKGEPMKLTIELTAAQYSRLAKRARSSGVSLEILPVLGIERLLDGLDDAGLRAERRAQLTKELLDGYSTTFQAAISDVKAGRSTGNATLDEFACFAAGIERMEATVAG